MRAGKLRALATLNQSRHPDLPDVPTMAEAGYGGFIESFWVGIVAPAGTPARIVAKLNAAINQALQSTEIRSGLAKLEAEPKSRFAAAIRRLHCGRDTEMDGDRESGRDHCRSSGRAGVR